MFYIFHIEQIAGAAGTQRVPFLGSNWMEKTHVVGNSTYTKQNVLQTGMSTVYTSTLFTETVQSAYYFVYRRLISYLLFRGDPSAGNDPHYLKLKKNLPFCQWME